MKDTNKIYYGDCLEVLKTLPDEFIQCVVTSPPYWGLRDYGTAKWTGGDSKCDHVKKYNSMQSDKSTLGGRNRIDSKRRDMHEYFKDECLICGAKCIDNQIGLEDTPEEYVSKIVEIFREVKRVLKNDGTLWLNIGDSYVGTGYGKGTGHFSLRDNPNAMRQKVKVPIGLKPKDMCGIPWRVGFALQADGWYLRSDIIWNKPNSMPEAVTDRPTKSHEYIFLLTKSSKYYYDNVAIANKSKWADSDKRSKGVKSKGKGLANKRSVWTVNTKSYREAHFAVFPEKLIEPCILAGCPKGGIVLDPFIGSGTTAQVALLNDRKYIGIELNPEYELIINKRIKNIQKADKNMKKWFDF